MYSGQWFGKWLGNWSGSIGEADPGAMYGTATFVFVASGNLTAATDSFLPIDPNYYPYLTSSDFDTINIYAGFNRFIVDYAYVEYPIDAAYSKFNISANYQEIQIDSNYDIMTTEAGYDTADIDAGFNTWQLN